jgi:hypothetical protein
VNTFRNAKHIDEVEERTEADPLVAPKDANSARGDATPDPLHAMYLYYPPISWVY